MLVEAETLLKNAYWKINWNKSRTSFEASKKDYNLSFKMSDDNKTLIASNKFVSKATDKDVEEFLKTIGMFDD
jgi:hypothetical protein